MRARQKPRPMAASTTIQPVRSSMRAQDENRVTLDLFCVQSESLGRPVVRAFRGANWTTLRASENKNQIEHPVVRSRAVAGDRPGFVQNTRCHSCNNQIVKDQPWPRPVGPAPRSVGGQRLNSTTWVNSATGHAGPVLPLARRTGLPVGPVLLSVQIPCPTNVRYPVRLVLILCLGPNSLSIGNPQSYSSGCRGQEGCSRVFQPGTRPATISSNPTGGSLFSTCEKNRRLRSLGSTEMGTATARRCNPHALDCIAEGVFRKYRCCVTRFAVQAARGQLPTVHRQAGGPPAGLTSRASSNKKHRVT